MSVNKLVCDWPGSSYPVLPAASATLSFKPVMSLNIECSLSISSLLCGNTFICSVFFVFWPKRNHYLVYHDNFLGFMIKSCAVKANPSIYPTVLIMLAKYSLNTSSQATEYHLLSHLCSVLSCYRLR